MKRAIVFGLLGLVLMVGSASASRAFRIAARSAFLADLSAGCPECLEGTVSRRVIQGNVAEYAFEVRTGTGEHDRIRMHRVVRERAPWVPEHDAPGLLMVHGDAWGFDGAFLASAASAAVPDGRALPVFLAGNGVDVWGVDLGWTLVPAAETDFTFLRTWGLARDARDVGIALGVARTVRLLTGDGPGKIDLLGWSRGGIIGYAYMNAEAQLPRALRNVRGFIPVDTYIKTNVESLRNGACLRGAATQAMIDAGTYQSTTGVLFTTLGQLAVSAPDAPSPIVPGVTDRQAALLAGAATFTFFAPDQVFAPFYHFTAGTFDAAGLPTGLLNTEVPYWFDYLQGASPYEPNRLLADSEATLCNTQDVPFDDHLGQIVAPTLYVGAGGGIGELGLYTTTLLGSHDVQSLIVDLRPPDQRLADFGHVDLFTAASAETLMWQPLLAWIRAH